MCNLPPLPLVSLPTQIAHAECLPVFRALSGCAGTVTALVSGRGEETRDAVLRVLAEESLRFDRAYFRPSSGAHALAACMCVCVCFGVSLCACDVLCRVSLWL